MTHYTTWTDVSVPKQRQSQRAKAERWFDVFRTTNMEDIRRQAIAQTLMLMRRLVHVSALERRRWKRRQWLRRMYAL